MAVIPMFPLGSVLLPGAVLPLHVFEPRYRALVRDCLDDPAHEFGVVLIERGSEVGGGDIRRDVGVVAKLLQVGQMDDGRYALVAVGTRRFRVNAWLPDDPYPLADVDDWLDDERDIDADAAATMKTVAAVHQRVRRAAATAAELGDGVAGDTDISADPLLASYHLVTLAPLGPADAYALLCAPGPVQRLALLDQMLDDVEAMQRFRLADEELPHWNG